MSNLRRSMMAAGRGSAIDWESIAKGMINMSTPFSLPLSVISVILDGRWALSGEVFYGRQNLQSVEIPDNISQLTGYCFYNCKGLTSLTLPSSITYIGTYNFSGCSNLLYIVIEATTPPNLININAFNSTNNCPIYVPDASVAAYKAANKWSSLASRIFPISDMPTT